MPASPRTLILTVVAVLVIGCSKPPITHVTRPTSQPSDSVDAVPVSEASADRPVELPAAPLPGVDAPKTEATAAVVQLEPPAVTAESLTRTSASNADHGPTGLPKLPGRAHSLSDLPESELARELPGLPGSHNRLPKNLPGLQGFGAEPAGASAR
jgi:hypothetical protein